MILALFFTALGMLKRKISSSPILKVKGFLNESKKVNLHLNRGQSFKDVYFIGVVDQHQAKENLPYQFVGMIIIEDLEKKRTMIRAETIRMIEEVQE